MIRTSKPKLAQLQRASVSLRHSALVPKDCMPKTFTNLHQMGSEVSPTSPPSTPPHAILSSLSTAKFFVNNGPVSGGPPDGKKLSKEQEQLVNLGNMIDYLSLIIPEALQMTPDPVKLDPNVKLRISPSIQPNVPIITGQLKYITSLKATQLIFKNFILNANTKLHVLKVDIINKDEACAYGILKGVTKLIVHWKTCGDQCFHLQGGSAIKDDHKELKSYDLFHNLINKYWLRYPSEEQSKRINDRVLFGIFVFELNEMNDQILVHNVENLEILNGKDFVDDDVMGLCS